MGYHSSDMVARACIFSIRAHWTPSKLPSSLLDHILEVAELVRSVGGTDIEQSAAWLHAVAQDANVPIDDVRKTFGVKIAEIVENLTSPPYFRDKPILERRALQEHRIRTMDCSVKLIKLACLTSEIKSVNRGYYSEWSKQERDDLIEGSYWVAMACWGVSGSLEREFNLAYLRARDFCR